MRLYLAELETRNFHFRAYGSTKRNASDALINGLVIHASQYDIEPTWWHEMADDIVVTTIRLGCYRGGELINVRQLDRVKNVV